jgi:hypothetical protein
VWRRGPAVNIAQVRRAIQNTGTNRRANDPTVVKNQFGCDPWHSIRAPARVDTARDDMRCVMRAYLETVAVIAALLGAYWVLLPLVV